ncbi:MAG: TonB-dependent receptor [Acidobacteria bacterium]|nr:TonB-dependent receptor [Acidobacteriota bacterium]
MHELAWARLSARLLPSLFIATAALWGQSAHIEVRVTDPSGGVVAGAAVTLLNPAGVALQSRRTGDQGKAELDAVAPGLYRVGVTAVGFEPLVRRVQLKAGDNTVELGLALATLASTVEVAAPEPEPLNAEVVSNARLSENPSTDLAENLRSTPGVALIRRGGTNLEPIVYGLRETEIAMVVDSTRTFAAGPARMDSDISHVEPGHIDSVRVVNGPYALTEGAGAMAALVVETPQVPRFDTFRMGGSLSAGWGSNGSSRFGRTRLWGGDRRVGFSLRAAGNKGNDYQAGRSGDRPEQSIPGDYSNHQFGGKLRLNPTDSQEIALAGLYDEQTGVDFPGRILNAVLFIQRGWNGSYLLKDPSRHVRAVKANLYLNKKSHRMTNDGKPTAMDMPGRTPPFALNISLPTESDTAGGSASVDLEPAPKNRVKLGFDFYNLAQDAQRFISRRSTGMLLFADNAWPDLTINDQGVYAQASRTYERGEISGAIRMDTVQADANRASDFFLANTTGSLKQNEVNLSFSTAGRFKLANGLSLGGGFGRVVRTANGLERYADRFPSAKFQVSAEFLGDPAIQPETAYQGDLNLEARIGGLRLSGGGFYRRIDDYISVQPDPSLPKRLPLSPPTVYRYVNGDHATFRGFQFGAGYWLARLVELKVQGQKTLADEINQDLPAIGFNEPVIGIAPLEITSAARVYEPGGRFWVEYAARAVFAQHRAAYARLETPSPGFTVHDVRIGADLPWQVTLNAGVENLGDKFYFEHLNSLNPFSGQRIPEPGRNVYVGMTKTW